MKKTLYFIVLATLCLFIRANAQPSINTLSPLKPGDVIPETVWQLTQQVTNEATGKETLKLDNYKGKAIILDFWATWCSSCISKFSKTDSLGKLFSNDLQFVLVNSIKGTGDSETKVKTFFTKYNSGLPTPLSAPSIINDSVLKALFPHSFIPHYVWIGKDGQVKAITSSEALTYDNMQKFVNNQSLSLANKIN
jgi:thiol-disulfide isomerase/thioredoxin